MWLSLGGGGGGGAMYIVKKKVSGPRKSSDGTVRAQVQPHSQNQSLTWSPSLHQHQEKFLNLKSYNLIEIEDTKKYISSQDKHYQLLTDDQISDLPPSAWTSQES